MQEANQSMVSDTTHKSVRACDNCVRKRARWYCAADDAFLCDACDSSVHSANPLARRHERVRLKTTSSSPSKENNEISFSLDEDDSRAGTVHPPSWHKGFTRKARTPRRQKKSSSSNNNNNNISKSGGKVASDIMIPLHLVPEEEICSEEESEEQLLYRVPVMDVFRREMSDFERINLLPSESEFAADVESLLGKGLEDEAFDIEGLGIFDDVEVRIKAEEDEEIGAAAEAEAEEGNHHHHHHHLLQIELGRETFELNFDYASPFTCDEEDNKMKIIGDKDDSSKAEAAAALLKLDYDRVMSAWDHKKSPWMSGERPEFTSGDWWPHHCCSGTSGAMHAYGEAAMRAAVGDGGREARVSRYREKRRTRLFSKKIRYEVRKLNAEKRPRMKGRFVKRASFAASAFPLLNK
ncbi:zinc finger protein CONSTANS-LIKE 16-like [Salvia miltiorrhiza]|uniref:zinc finger protein CONSTANS-LIKE 16-like n=1 Tax=Salvia miltiorrhiza TaxID=226208 RepID=UPI0025AC4845|nr:zinc finger protein CONSTANS-LIKE 16-like [Salvia miltiorrhiza]